MKKQLAATLDALTPAMFTFTETGAIRAGFQWNSVSDGDSILHECYQFDTLADVLECGMFYQSHPDIRRFAIVTHAGQYQKMRTLYRWSRP